MPHDLIVKKLEQMKKLLSELRQLLDLPYSEFKKAFTNIRTAERNFQLVVEFASDINTHIIAEVGAATPDTYRESFRRLASLKILKEDLLPQFIKSANLRNILVHEYDFDEDDLIFYQSAKEFLPLYEQYILIIRGYLDSVEKRTPNEKNPS